MPEQPFLGKGRAPRATIGLARSEPATLCSLGIFSRHAGRPAEATRWYGYHYDLVTVKGELAVTNFLDKNITLEITKTLQN